jgi:thymidylate synthase (FAD)
MRVRIIATTQFEGDPDVPWQPEVHEVPGFEPITEGGAQDLIEFAGRACYESWGRPNPATATNAGYVRHIVEVAHESVLEHPSVTFYITGVSRSFTHELVRHRHLSYSQRSQRFVDEGVAHLVVPDAIRGDTFLESMYRIACNKSQNTYRNLVSILEQRGLSRKNARSAARAVLPNGIETRIVVTGNLRAWRYFIGLRLKPEVPFDDPNHPVEVEIRTVAREILTQLAGRYPDVFADLIDTVAYTLGG